MVAAISALFTSSILTLLKWLENKEETPTKRVVAMLLSPFIGIAPREAHRGPGPELESLDTPKYA